MNSFSKINIGSTSEIKYFALKDALQQLQIDAEIQQIAAKSGQKAQPFSFESTYLGALKRAQTARLIDPSIPSIGIENGIISFITYGKGMISMDLAVIVLIAPDGREILTTSQSVVVPQEYISEATLKIDKGFNDTTVGEIIAKRLGGDPNDPHLTLTRGKNPDSGVDRRSTLIPGIVMLLKQL